MRIHLTILVIFFSFQICFSQQQDSLLTGLRKFPDKYFSKVDKKLNSVTDRLTKKSAKYLQKLEKHERKLQQKLQRLNPETATNLFEGTKEKYDQFSQQIKSKTGKLNK